MGKQLIHWWVEQHTYARLVIKDNKVVGEERLLGDKGERFRDVIQGKNGALYSVTDGGKLYKVDKK